MWCPQTNTFITHFGEVEISLWDIRCIGRLLIIGDLYEDTSLVIVNSTLEMILLL